MIDPSSDRGTGGQPNSSDENYTDLVTILGIVSIIFGGLKLLCGGGVLFGFEYFSDEIVQLLESSNHASPEELSSTIYLIILIVIVVLLLIPGLLQVIGGTGVLKRENWGRILTLILGGLDAFLALPQLMSGNPIGFILSGGWGAFALYVLLSDPYKKEFYNQ